MIVVDTEEQLRMYFNLLDQLPEVKVVIAWGIEKVPEDLAKDSRIYTFKQFMELGKGVEDGVINKTI